MASVVLQRLTKQFGSVTAVDALDLEVQDGEFVTLLGPSGCGKSTALACVAGLEQPTAGEVMFDGESVTGSCEDDPAVPMGCDHAMVVFEFLDNDGGIKKYIGNSDIIVGEAGGDCSMEEPSEFRVWLCDGEPIKYGAEGDSPSDRINAMTCHSYVGVTRHREEDLHSWAECRVSEPGCGE